jgi:hypothetical protein
MLLIPREANKLRLYIELGLENGLIDASTDRVAVQNMDALRLLKVSKSPTLHNQALSNVLVKKIAETALRPFVIPPAEIDWWTCYVGVSN